MGTQKSNMKRIPSSWGWAKVHSGNSTFLKCTSIRAAFQENTCKHMPARTLQQWSFTLNTELFNSQPITLTNVWTVGSWIPKKKKKINPCADGSNAASNTERIWGGLLYPSTAAHRSGCLFVATTTTLPIPPLPFFMLPFYLWCFLSTQNTYWCKPLQTRVFFRGARKICC